MEYLFFDIECANNFAGSGKICEFGYVITDQQFQVKEKKLFLINPNSGFDWYVAKKMLAFPIAIYRSANLYPFFYPEIKKLFDKKDTLIIGHTVDADAGYLNDEARRYGLPFFNYVFYDAKEMFAAYANSEKSVGLEQIGRELGSSGPEHAHKSVDDAEATMETVKAMCGSLEVTPEELISLCPDCCGKTENGIIWTPVRERAKIKREQDFSETVFKNRIEKGVAKMFIKWRNGIDTNTKSKSPLSGKTICFSRNYEDGHLKEMMFLIKKLAEMGVKCIGKASECDLFIKCDLFDENGEEIKCARFQAVCSEINAGRQIEILTIEELLVRIDMTADDLRNAPIPCKEDFEFTQMEDKNKRGSTIGEILRASGFDLTKQLIA